MAQDVDNRMSRLCGRAMSVAQNARDSLEYILEEMEFIVEENPDREDIKACVDEIKTKCKSSESENWAATNKWSEHFDGISTDDSDADESDNSSDSDADKD